MIETIIEKFSVNSVLTYVIVGVWLIQQFKSFGKIDVKNLYQMNQDIKETLEPKCKEIAMSFNADRVLFWQFRNGMKFMKNWPDKDMSAIAEYHKDGMMEFASKFQNVPIRLFNRNIHNLIKSPNGILIVPDEHDFKDDLSVINITYGWRSMIACFCKDNKGDIIGILVVGWEEPNKACSIDQRALKVHSYHYYRLISTIIFKYSFWNKLKFTKRILKQ